LEVHFVQVFIFIISACMTPLPLKCVWTNLLPLNSHLWHVLTALNICYSSKLLTLAVRFAVNFTSSAHAVGTGQCENWADIICGNQISYHFSK